MSRAAPNAHCTVQGPALHRPLERLFDRQGRAELGWVQANVLYVRLDGMLSASLAEQYAARLGSHLAAAAQAYVFLDSSRLRACELSAKSALLRTFMANRQRLTRVVVLSAPELRHSNGPCLLATLAELVQYVSKPTFDRWLLALAPSAPEKVSELSTSQAGITASLPPEHSLIRPRVRT